jgi:hypothetical protein
LDLLLHSPIFINIFLNQKLKIPSKFDFRLEFSDFDKIFLLRFQNMEMYLWCFLTPKGLNVHMVDKPVLVCVT